MPEDFDIGPLTWVKDEINQSLDSVLENLATVQTNVHDTSVLRFSQTYLYQASGALDMVGLEGCKLFCSKLEKLAAQLEKKEIEATPEVLEVFAKAVNVLKDYIQALLNGAADTPLRLYPALQSVVSAQGEMLSESELFYPDTSNSAPKDIPSQEFSDEGYAAFIAEQRLLYQKSFLSWMQTKESNAVAGMHEAISNAGLAQNKPSVKTLWWAASAFAETLTQSEIAENVAAKRLCRKLDQELKQLSAGEAKPNYNLLRDILYFVAISEVDKPTVQKVKEVFSLDELVDKKSSALGESEAISADELLVVDKLKSELDGLRELWEDVSNSIDFDETDTSTEDTLIDLDSSLMLNFTEKLNTTQELTQKLSQAPVVDLFAALLEASNVLRDDKSKANPLALVEVATTLHFLDDALVNYQNIDVDNVQNMLSEVERLEVVATGLNYDKLKGSRIGGLDRETVAAVVKDVKASLKVIEQALDTFFRSPEEKASLALAPAPLAQIAATFDMLNMPVPKQITTASVHFIQYFQQADYKENQADFELVAESLSMIGLYVDEMPKVRPESVQALDGALTRLTSALEATGIEFVTETVAMPDVVVSTAEKGPEGDDTPKLVEEGGNEEKTLDEAFDEELLDIYLTEAEDVLGHIAQNLQALRVNETDHEPLVEVRRSFHTLKGSGRTVGLVAQGEVAGKVEAFLNEVLDKKEFLTSALIIKLEEIAATFAAWSGELRANNHAYIAEAYWAAKVAELSQPATSKAKTKAKKSSADKKEHVLIGGKRKLSRALYEIFLEESKQNIDILDQDIASLAENKTEQPETAANRAIHTLASNALASGFTQMGELCRALEAWLGEVGDKWTPEYLELYTNAMKTVAIMWEKVSELKNPRAAHTLIKVLNESAEKARKSKKLATTPESTPTPSKDVEIVVEEMPTGENADIELKLITEPRALDDVSLFNTENVDPELLTMFIEEANEILPEIGTELRAWRADPKAKVHSEALQRSLHTLKGSARMAGQGVIGDIAHGFEEQVLHATKNTPVDEDFERMFVDLDTMGGFFETAIDEAPEAISGLHDDDDAQHMARAMDRKSQFLRLRAATLDRLINEAGEVSIIRSRMDREMVGFKQSSNDLTDSLVRLRGYLRELEIEAETQMQSRMNILQESDEGFDPLEFDRFTRLQELTRMIAESVNDVGTIQTSLLGNLDQTEAALQQQNRMNRDLQQGLLGVRMLPFQQISERMQRIVRQTARELKKSVDLVIVGESTEIDRSVLDRVGAPLEHLLRNAIAHGIESASKREASGKPKLGTIRLSINTQNDEIHIRVSDDGDGIDFEKVKEKAIENKLLTKSAKVTEQELLSVIFEPGFSTADKISQIAGRGVGLDVVRNDISGLGGRIDMSSEAGKGAEFNIYLPVTQSVAQVLLVRSGESVYGLPVAMIEQAQKIRRNELVDAYKAGEISWADSKYPLHQLARLLDHRDHQLEDAAYASILLLRSGAHTVAIHVDDVMGNQEIVMKPIGSQLARVPGIVGAAVTGDGSIVLIINPVQMANREILSVSGTAVEAMTPSIRKEATKVRALVVDDSLTMRVVLGRLLEREGYEVLLAKDGMDAMEVLQTTTPDIILTDIEMPRMDGFGLSRNIRDDARTAETPLIMISSRTADKHQNLATEIGVDAFFGKPVQNEELVERMKELLADKK